MVSANEGKYIMRTSSYATVPWLAKLLEYS